MTPIKAKAAHGANGAGFLENQLINSGIIPSPQPLASIFFDRFFDLGCLTVEGKEAL